jgi:hypothetical protein
MRVEVRDDDDDDDDGCTHRLTALPVFSLHKLRTADT